MAFLQTTLALCVFGVVTTSVAGATPNLKPFCQGCNTPAQPYTLYAQLTFGMSFTGAGFSWLKPLSGSGMCAKQGVLQMDPPSWAKSLTLHLTFSNPTAWSFNLGDSESNNGHAGDSGHHTHGYAAEIHNIAGNLYIWKNDLPNGCNSKSMYYVPGIISSRLTIRVSHDQLCIDNGDGVTIFKVDRCLFNFDRMFLGFNRVIHNRYGSASMNRVGSGLCSVLGAWSPKMVTDP